MNLSKTALNVFYSPFKAALDGLGSAADGLTDPPDDKLDGEPLV